MPNLILFKHGKYMQICTHQYYAHISVSINIITNLIILMSALKSASSFVQVVLWDHCVVVLMIEKYASVSLKV
jgi:uncharacterized membrane protein YjfL (UPF0719 family)